MNWFDDLKNQALVVLPNMPTNYIENAIQNAARKFFRETHLLKGEAYIDAECGMSDYIIDVPQGQTIIQVKAVHSCSHPSEHPLLDETWRGIPPAHHRFGNGFWVELQYSQPTISFAGGHNLNNGRYCVEYSWTPTDKSCELPHHFVGKYFDVLLHGVLGDLFLIPTEADTQSSQMAKYHIAEFLRGIKNAGVEETQNHTSRPLFMHGNPFL